MTEAEWLNGKDTYPKQLLVIQEHASARKLRLIAAVLVRYLQSQDAHEEAKRCADLIELCADDAKPWDHWELQLHQVPGNWRFTHILFPTESERVVKELRKLVAFYHYEPPDYPLTVLLDVVGNPFRPVARDPAWLTSDVLALARGIYDERAFDRMPILADALQDAGCNEPDVLNHCREKGTTHVRGCWVVDLLLGKS